MENNRKFFIAREVQGTVEQVSEKIVKRSLEEGFGLVTELDMDQKIGEKLDVKMKPYKILGLCNPNLGYQTIQAEPEIGIFLPCKIVVRQINNNKVKVAAMNPLGVMGMLENPELNKTAEKVTKVFEKVVDQL